MVLWRISNYADLLGLGGISASARWHTAGRPVVYLAETPASALLEVLVHLEIDEEHMPDSYQLLKVETDPSITYDTLATASLSADWRLDEAQTQTMGDEWLRRNETALLQVPSVITPETWNWVLNPRHPDAKKLTILSAEKHLLDSRLFRP